MRGTRECNKRESVQTWGLVNSEYHFFGGICMKQTENYGLNQWELADRIQMEDFNGDNAKIEAALAGLAGQVAAKADNSTVSNLTTKVNAKAEQSALNATNTNLNTLTAQVAKCGNCRITYGTYTGTGTYGSGNPNTLTFDADPLMVFIKGSVGSAPTLGIQAMRGWSIAYSGSDSPTSRCELTWGDHSLSWYNSESMYNQFNEQGVVYPYIALFAVDE